MSHSTHGPPHPPPVPAPCAAIALPGLGPSPTGPDKGVDNEVGRPSRKWRDFLIACATMAGKGATMMDLRIPLALGVVALGGLAYAADDDDGGLMIRPMIPRTIIASQTMYGVEGGFLGLAGTLRGIPGDDLPWEIGKTRAQLTTAGRLILNIEGLVFTDDESVPLILRGKNDEEYFRAVVSCYTEDVHGAIVVHNAYTRPFAANVEGDAATIQLVDLPEACVDPLILVLGGDENKWFAVTGVELAEEED
jgi:hypothetical protein